MSKPKSEKLCPGVEQIPFEALERLGAIFAEGEKKYGLDNWKISPEDKEYNTERTRHAIRHLMLYANGDRQEDHLAKVMWYCVTTIWRTNYSLESILEACKPTQVQQAPVVGILNKGAPVVFNNGTYQPIAASMSNAEIAEAIKKAPRQSINDFLPFVE